MTTNKLAVRRRALPSSAIRYRRTRGGGQTPGDSTDAYFAHRSYYPEEIIEIDVQTSSSVVIRICHVEA